MAFRHVLLGNVLVNCWSDTADVGEVDQAFQAARRAYSEVGKISNIAVMAPSMKFPTLASIDRMRKDREQMISFHRSVHHLLLFTGSGAVRAMTLIASTLMEGTRGIMHINKTAKEAIESAKTYGPLNVEEERIYQQLKLYGVPDERLGR